MTWSRDAAFGSTTTSISGSVSVICGCAAIKRAPSAAAGDTWAEPDGEDAAARLKQ